MDLVQPERTSAERIEFVRNEIIRIVKSANARDTDLIYHFAAALTKGKEEEGT